jgi:hypothetical protein
MVNARSCQAGGYELVFRESESGWGELRVLGVWFLMGGEKKRRRLVVFVSACDLLGLWRTGRLRHTDTQMHRHCTHTNMEKTGSSDERRPNLFGYY